MKYFETFPILFEILPAIGGLAGIVGTRNDNRGLALGMNLKLFAAVEFRHFYLCGLAKQVEFMKVVADAEDEGLLGSKVEGFIERSCRFSNGSASQTLAASTRRRAARVSLGKREAKWLAVEATSLKF